MKTKTDELLVMRAVLTFPRPSEHLIKLGLAPKRLDFILEKWTTRGWWDFGVSLRTGWITDRGRSAMREIMMEMFSGRSAQELRA